MARPTKYNPAVAEAICNYLRRGNTRRAATALARISEDTFARWLARYADFAADIASAEAAAEVYHVNQIQQAAKAGTWAASAWWLERRRSQDWGRRDKVEVMASVRELAREYGVDEGEAVAEAEAILRELRGAGKPRK